MSILQVDVLPAFVSKFLPFLALCLIIVLWIAKRPQIPLYSKYERVQSSLLFPKSTHELVQRGYDEVVYSLIEGRFLYTY